MNNNKRIFAAVVTLIALFGWSPVFAQDAGVPAPVEYKLLQPIPLDGPNSGVSSTTRADQYIPALYRLVIGLATGLAVVMLIYGGFQYMTTDAFSGKSSAKETITNALMGLMLALSAWLIVYTINPKLVSLNLNIPKNEIVGGKLGGGGVVIPGTNTSSSNCANCQTITVPHKPAPRGCLAPGPCQINPSLDARLAELNKQNRLYVTESYPPTYNHEDLCHNNGTCVDATISSNTPQSVKIFLENASKIGLNATFEVISQNRYNELTKGGVPSSKIMLNTKANGEHFHIK